MLKCFLFQPSPPHCLFPSVDKMQEGMVSGGVCVGGGGVQDGSLPGHWWSVEVKR